MRRAGIALWCLCGVLVGCGGRSEDVGRREEQGTHGPPPYPHSQYLTGITWDESTHRHAAPGSDNWPTTWAADGNVYTAWGDGGGFGGTNELGRVSLGVARIEGPWNQMQFANVWGGHRPKSQAQTFRGKSYGLLSVDGTLYMSLYSQEGVPEYTLGQIAVSNDNAMTFDVGLSFDEEGPAMAVNTFANFGQDYRGAIDDFVYVYTGLPLPGCIKWCVGHEYFLARVPVDSILDRSAYEFFAGTEGDNVPRWSEHIDNRVPIFEDPNGASTRFGVIYSQALGRFLLSNSHHNRGGLGIFEAETPWGPWKTVAYYADWLDFGYSPSYHIGPAKWFSDDGRQFILNWSSEDRFNLIRGEFIVEESHK